MILQSYPSWSQNFSSYKECYKLSHLPMTGIRWNMHSHLVFYYIFPPEFEISQFLGWIVIGLNYYSTQKLWNLKFRGEYILCIHLGVLKQPGLVQFDMGLRDCVTQRTQCDPKDTEPTLAWPLHTPVSMSFMDCLLFKEHFFPAYFQ